MGCHSSRAWASFLSAAYPLSLRKTLEFREGVNTMEETQVLEAEKAEQLDVVEESLAYDIMLVQMDAY